jgi:hypothetical protein
LLILDLACAALVGRAGIILVGIKLVILTGLMIAGAIGMIGKTPVPVGRSLGPVEYCF